MASAETTSPFLVQDFQKYPRMIVYYVLKAKEGGYLVPGGLISFLFRATGMLPMQNHRIVHPIPTPSNAWVNPRQYANLDEMLQRWNSLQKSL